MANRIIPYNPKLRAFAKDLRNHPTPAEQKLWEHIRKKQLRGFEFHRQVPIDAFIVDFYCHELSLAIELDGKIHDYKILEDSDRQGRIESLGVQVIRFENQDIFQRLSMVLDRLYLEISLRQ